MPDAEKRRRTRAAYHEAAHAVLVARKGFEVRESFLTRGTMHDGSLGGWTGWDNPLADEKASPIIYERYARDVAAILYAGQLSERVLAEQDRTVLVPDHDPAWDHDDNEAARFLTKAGMIAVEREIRSEAFELVRELWHVIDHVAGMVLAPLPAHAPVSYSGHTPESPVVRSADVQMVLKPIDSEIHVAFNSDQAVVHHELGHLVVWFLNGGGVGSLRFWRDQDGLYGKLRVGPRSDHEGASTEYIDSVAERILAGEVAARQLLNLRDWQVSVGQYAILANSGSPVARVRSQCDPALLDASKFFRLAEQYHCADWWAWMEGRLRRVRRLLTDHSAAVSLLAERLLPHLPADGGEWIIPGTDILHWSYAAGLNPADRERPPVELVSGDCLTHFRIAVRRWWRSWGRHAVRVRIRNSEKED